jgi:hypothetical protein
MEGVEWDHLALSLGGRLSTYHITGPVVHHSKIRGGLQRRVNRYR